MMRLLLLLMITGCSNKGDPGFGGEGDPVDPVVDTETPEPTLPDQPNILLLIADDLGVDQMALYQDLTGLTDHSYARTPTLDAVCNDGIRFERTWAQPTCVPTRGNLLTGRHGFRTGMLSAGTSQDIPPDEVTLPMLLSEAGYRTANIGKWHLGSNDDLGGIAAPNTMGWDHYNGHLVGQVNDYREWVRVEDGEQFEDTRYLTTAQIDDALTWIDSAELDQPWLLWMGFTSPHIPLHVPPESLHDNPDLSEDSDTNEQFNAMVEALDSETARLLAALESRGELEETVIIFLGDNGTEFQLAQAEAAASPKGTLGQGGVWVPMCARGPGLASGVSTSALAHVIDVYGTAVELSGVSLEGQPEGVAQDTRSLLPLLLDPSVAHRDTLYSETDSQRGGIGGVAVRGERYKLIVEDDGTEALFDLVDDIWEEDDLIDEKDGDDALETAYEALTAAISELRGG